MIRVIALMQVYHGVLKVTYDGDKLRMTSMGSDLCREFARKCRQIDNDFNGVRFVQRICKEILVTFFFFTFW